MRRHVTVTGCTDDELAAQVAALLELYGRSSPNPDLLLTGLPVLLGALRRALQAGPQQQPLAERLSGLINKLSRWELEPPHVAHPLVSRIQGLHMASH